MGIIGIAGWIATHGGTLLTSMGLLNEMHGAEKSRIKEQWRAYESAVFLIQEFGEVESTSGLDEELKKSYLPTILGRLADAKAGLNVKKDIVLVAFIRWALGWVNEMQGYLANARRNYDLAFRKLRVSGRVLPKRCGN